MGFNVHHTVTKAAPIAEQTKFPVMRVTNKWDQIMKYDWMHTTRLYNRAINRLKKITILICAFMQSRFLVMTIHISILC